MVLYLLSSLVDAPLTEPTIDWWSGSAQRPLVCEKRHAVNSSSSIAKLVDVWRECASVLFTREDLVEESFDGGVGEEERSPSERALPRSLEALAIRQLRLAWVIVRGDHPGWCFQAPGNGFRGFEDVGEMRMFAMVGCVMSRSR